MATGLLGLGDQHLDQAQQALQQSAALTQQRNDFNRAAKKKSTLGVISNVAQGAGTGASIGSAAGPQGAAIGGSIGAGLALLSSFF